MEGRSQTQGASPIPNHKEQGDFPIQKHKLILQVRRWSISGSTDGHENVMHGEVVIK